MSGPLPPQPGSRGTVSPTILLVALVVIATVALFMIVGATGALDRGSPSPGPTSLPSATGGPSPEPSAEPSPSGPTSSGATPSPSSAGAAVLVGAGDIGDCDTTEDDATAALLDEIDGTVFTAGDNAYDSGKAEEFATCYDETWGRHRDRTRPATGNHDWRTGTLDGYIGYFGAAGQGPGGTSWYSYDLGAWHVIVLDSECDESGGCDADSPQGRWLAADLAGSDATCTVAIWHRPRFSSGQHGNDSDMDPFWEALYATDADVVVNGHDHDYERFAPQDPGGNEDRARGLREFVVGTGGTPLRAFEDPRPNSELRYALTHGVFKMTLHDGSYDWEFIPTSGDFSDRGTASCH